ncbi:hypothetical protein [Candidatus Nitrosotalea okcheonensis]|uniref:Uncharacterized protein n=1 Tax=Candidatus Nitrosotalea okcheonensis TaxID=1903276 RepID=A0A2H1FF16_9ARCH|nr:hypothetical protein [Candidatus Nitrosotalea okcheonensis]SMH71347.1 conserved protein of unknown function [Candidatus Nitrosotalea okcheonensis]
MKRRNENWKVDLDLLTPKQLAKYHDSIEALYLIRHGSLLKKASKITRVSVSTIKKYVGSTLRVNNRKTIARKSDSLLRKMSIYENGKEVFIQVKGRKKASLIGKYHSAIGRLDQNDMTKLQSFQEIKIRDIKGKVHKFEINVDKIKQILERIEEPEFFDIYRSN